MANTNPVEFDKPFTLRANQSFHDKLDAIRATRSPLPTKAELLRELVDEEFARVKTRRR